jgi:putative ABC transport system permease protein
VPVAWVTGRLAARRLSSLLYEVTATDPITIAAAIGVLVIVALGAGSLPAGRAARIDPAMALRSE